MAHRADFDNALHRAVVSSDGTNTAYSQQYGEHYHSTRDGALLETYSKHVYPGLAQFVQADTLRILDMCYGLGFNTLATLAALKARGERKRLEIVSPELDRSLVASLTQFAYPDDFTPFRPVIEAVARQGVYEDDTIRIEVLFGDARAILPTLERPFDVVYQDAFSLKCNPALWTREYFAELARLTHERSIITSYSTALPVRLALLENGFNVYLNTAQAMRDATVASRAELPCYAKVDMAHKIRCNPNRVSLSDADLPPKGSNR